MAGLAAWVAFAVAGALPAALSAAPPIREYQLKAVFLFNFAQFVEWPADAFSDPTAPLVIGVLGDDPFNGYLDETVRGERVNDRELTVVRYRSVEEIGTCHVLFVTGSESPHFGAILARLRGRSILTVGDAPGFSDEGGIIRFVTEDNRIRLRINPDAAKEASLRISSKLLRPSEIVGRARE